MDDRNIVDPAIAPLPEPFPEHPREEVFILPPPERGPPPRGSFQRLVAALTHPWLALTLLTVAGAAWRWALFSGDGLGDDPNFFGSYYGTFASGWFKTAYNYRFAQWMPIYATWKLLGVSERTWILPITLAAVATIPLAYLLGTHLFSRRAGLVAALLHAANPFDTLASTLFITDVILALYLGLAVLCFLYGDTLSRKAWYVLAGVFVAVSYFAKMWGPFILPFFGLLTLSQPRRLLRHWPFYGTVALLAALSFLGDRYLSGDVFGYYRTTVREAGLWKMSVIELLEYPRQMFLRNEHGNYFHGFYFWALIPCLPLVLLRRDRAVIPLLWLLVLLLTLEFMPQKVTLDGWYTQGHYFRYLSILVLPTCLVLAYGFDTWLRWTPRLAVAALFIFVSLSLVHAYHLTFPSRDAFDDMRRGADTIVAMNPDVVYADVGMRNRLVRFTRLINLPGRVIELMAHNPADRRAELEKIQSGWVITGGGRMPYYGDPFVTANLSGSFVPPPGWVLLWTLQKPPAPYRQEPLRIWRVNRP